MISGFFYPLKGCLFFLKHRSLWKHLIKSIFISIVLLFLVIGGASKHYTLHIAQTPMLKKVILTTLLTIISAIIFFAINSMLTARFMKALSRHVEKIVLQKEIQEPKVSFGQMIKGIFHAIRSIPFFLLILALNFVPVVGQILTLYYLGRNYTSFPLELRTDKNAQKKVSQNALGFITFGFTATLMMIPPFTIISHPMCVVGGTLMTLEKIDA
ncbi:EI24 domain-containing protein [Candidatus Uabimicrobium amorphum]|uniref:Sulfate transporter CysZ n=1 Tax=Uabimicrobium amorphum TaxID=2596890 RepID=A0A5S9ILX8_UABAM|nr:EI24 domain-containing protein [Candidatus Uabimicrobium amorphum]BBM83771.1 sulfate transporter CysZ [Candidatus Uabimicrobium amorphum]